MKFNTLATSLAFTLLLALPTFAQQAFHDDDVMRTRAFLTESAGGDLDCLETLNKAARILYNDEGMRLASTVDLTMGRLAGLERAEPARKFGFIDAEGKSTFGVTAPKTLAESVWDGLVEMSGGVKGWHVFGFSPLDGNHSVLLFLDTRGDEAKVYWADQWGTKGGFKLYPSKKALDGEIERLTASWWKTKLATLKVKFKTDAKIYQLKPDGAAAAGPAPAVLEIAEVSRGWFHSLRSAPSNRSDRVARASRGATFKVISRQGSWVELEDEEGTRSWLKSRYLKIKPIDGEKRGGATSVLSRLGS